MLSNLEKINFKRLNNALKPAKRILIILKKHFTSDELGTALVLKNYLQITNKKVSLVNNLPENKIPLKYSFLLNKPEEILNQIPSNSRKKLVINTDKFEIEKIEQKKNKCIIFLDKKQKSKLLNLIQTTNFLKIKKSTKSWDLIIMLGAQKLEKFLNGKKDNQVLNNTTILNIDNNIDNERFGTINAIFPQYVSISQIIYKWLKLKKHTLNAADANRLLSGIIEKTNAFYTPNPSALLFNSIAELIRQGADKDLIIKHLYKTKSESLLKFFGKALEGINSLEKQTHQTDGVYFILNKNDFDQSINPYKGSLALIKELIKNFDLGETIIVIFQKEDEALVTYWTKSLQKIETFELHNSKDLLQDSLKKLNNSH